MKKGQELLKMLQDLLVFARHQRKEKFVSKSVSA